MREYAMLVQTCSCSLDDAMRSEEPGELIAKTLAASAEGLTRNLSTLDGGGWQVLSHDVLETNGVLVVSFLIFRQPRGKW